MKALRYFAWNAIIIGTLAAGYFLNCMNGTGMVIGVVYGVVIIPSYVLITVLNSTKRVREELVKMKLSIEWTVAFEPIFIGGVAMIAEAFMHIYLCLVAMEARKAK